MKLKTKNYSLSAGQYLEVKIEYVDITQDEFEAKLIPLIIEYHHWLSNHKK